MTMLAATLLMLASSTATTSTNVTGLWVTDDGKGLVRIEPCGAKLCGRIVKVLDTRPDVPRTDVHNPNPRLRARPLAGLLTLWDFTRSDAAWTGGRAYDPKSGKSYRSSLARNPDGSLKLTGCVLFICESRRWTRGG